MKPRRAFILNAGAGGTSGGAWLEQHRERIDALAAGGPVALVHGGDDITAAIDRGLAAGCTCIVAGGGDGTINAVASRLLGTDTVLGVLPLGTLNHFAKDLGLPLDASAALDVIDRGHVMAVDVGDVNGRTFINNSSLGLYPHIVTGRDRQQERLGWGKWPAFAWATIGALRRFPFLDIRLAVESQPDAAYRTPFLFVGNNHYNMEGVDLGTRDALTGGVLSLYFANRTGRLGLVRLAFHALLRTLSQARDFNALTATSFTVETRHKLIAVATDGEVQVMEAPLSYRVKAGALRVLVPIPASNDSTVTRSNESDAGT